MRWHRHRWTSQFHYEDPPAWSNGWLHNCCIYQYRVHEVQTCRCGETRESYSYANGTRTADL